MLLMQEGLALLMLSPASTGYLILWLYFDFKDEMCVCLTHFHRKCQALVKQLSLHLEISNLDLGQWLIHEESLPGLSTWSLLIERSIRRNICCFFSTFQLFKFEFDYSDKKMTKLKKYVLCNNFDWNWTTKLEFPWSWSFFLLLEWY